MSYSYTPGLKVKESYEVIQKRQLPICGKVLVQTGDIVSPDTVVASCDLPGDPFVVNLADELRVDSEEEDISKMMIKKVGDKVEKGELLAQTSSWFGLSKFFCRSPCNGTIETISRQIGQVFIRGSPVEVNLLAYIPGTVVEVVPTESVIIRTHATFIQGIFGVGGETNGEIMVIDGIQDGDITADQIESKLAGKILVGKSSITAAVLHKAVDVGVKGVIVGGIRNKDLVEFLGYEIGVAITGNEEIGLTLILTEGFGKMQMQNRVFELLRSNEGKQVSINGATQIRAGVIRPEIIIPRADVATFSADEKKEILDEGTNVGSHVRIIRDPYFGNTGYVTALPVELYRLPSESQVRVLEVELEDGKRVIVPRANIEIIEE